MKRNELRSQQQLLLDVIEDECNHGSGVRIGRERRWRMDTDHAPIISF
jgi:hypothetical protein